ncbi:DUF6473 family protein [Pararhodobacter sp. CCB-MM2]|uniref:DUF6473 family protein n=1 Tax=Pararhodobacter sp. CCB-MM2 TaxID=1786003 RepID=UPI00082AF53F|nr:DUF6473 family protein [Pararhodobacter sp. CCB-MM2]
MHATTRLPEGGQPPLLLQPKRQVGPQHKGLMLIGPRGTGRLRAAVADRVLARLLAPTALVEGVDYHLGDALLLDRASRAQSVLMLLPSLGNLSNAFYRVHPRRNDRFVVARAPLRALFPEVDFALFTFTGHALGTLHATCPERFGLVRQALVEAWLLRMGILLDMLPQDGVLISTPAPSYLARPPVPTRNLTVLALRPEDRAGAAQALRHALLPMAA